LHINLPSMGLGDERLVNPATVSTTLRCSICTDVYIDPVFSSGKPCQHVFCRSCIDEALRQRQQCPSCRAPLKKQRLQPHQAIRSLLDELSVNCEAGCSWTGRQDAYPAHVAACPAKLLEAARRQLEQQAAKLRENDIEIARLNEMISELQFRADERAARASRKDAQIMALQEELAKVRLCMERDAEVRLAELQAEVTAKIAKDAQAIAEAAAKSAEIARQRADCIAMQVFIRRIGGRTMTLNVELTDTVDAIKRMIQEKDGTPPDMFYLTHGSKHLDDSKSVAEHQISRNSTLAMRMRLLSQRQNFVDDGDHDLLKQRTKRRKCVDLEAM